ncbi:DUF2231 domain-containing protein [Streptomyces thermolineatus]|uniref:DUF2231 domain-containing protein n=1 Tax=Streptomyces thermolineatus TaxID=44033 RepID=UPI0031DDD534
MELTTFNGPPAHVLLAHFVVVLVLLAALGLVVCAIWPAIMARAGIGLPLLALVSLILVPLTTEAGEWLEDRVDETALVEEHAELGESLLPWVIGLFVLSALLWFFRRRASAAAPAAGPADAPARSAAFADSLPFRVVAVVLSLVVGIGAAVQVYRIGHSGAEAVWKDNFSPTPLEKGGNEGGEEGE